MADDPTDMTTRALPIPAQKGRNLCWMGHSKERKPPCLTLIYTGKQPINFKAFSGEASLIFLISRSLSSPAAAAAAAAAGLFPPGLEALYRQAGFPAFLGLNAGGAAGNTAAGGANPGGAPNPASAATSPHVSTSGTTPSPYCNIGLQSHANNPNCKCIKN